MSSYGIIYAARSKAVRRIVISDDPNYDYSVHVGDGRGNAMGEALVIADTKNGTDIFAARAAVEAATGEKSPEPLVAIVDKDGIVVEMVLIELDLHPGIEGRELVPAYAGVAEGQTYDKASATFIEPEKVIPAGVDKEGRAYPEKTEPAKPVAKPASVALEADTAVLK